MTITYALSAIALSFARNCCSPIVDDSGHGCDWNAAQLHHDYNLFDDDEYWNEPNLVDYSIIQLGMMADLQLEADDMYWLHDEANAINADVDEERLILRTIAMGAGDVETALRWLEDA
jgi:hypothetical protein